MLICMQMKRKRPKGHILLFITKWPKSVSSGQATNRVRPSVAKHTGLSIMFATTIAIETVPFSG